MNDKLKEQAYQEWKISVTSPEDNDKDNILRATFNAMDEEDQGTPRCYMNKYEAAIIKMKMDSIIEYCKKIENEDNVVGSARMIYLTALQLKKYAVSKMETPTNKEHTK